MTEIAFDSFTFSPTVKQLIISTFSSNIQLLQLPKLASIVYWQQSDKHLFLHHETTINRSRNNKATSSNTEEKISQSTSGPCSRLLFRWDHDCSFFQRTNQPPPADDDGRSSVCARRGVINHRHESVVTVTNRKKSDR